MDGPGVNGHIEEDVLGVLHLGEHIDLRPLAQMGIQPRLGGDGSPLWYQGHKFLGQPMVGGDLGHLEPQAQRGEAVITMVEKGGEQNQGRKEIKGAMTPYFKAKGEKLPQIVGPKESRENHKGYQGGGIMELL